MLLLCTAGTVKLILVQIFSILLIGSLKMFLCRFLVQLRLTDCWPRPRHPRPSATWRTRVLPLLGTHHRLFCLFSLVHSDSSTLFITILYFSFLSRSLSIFPFHFIFLHFLLFLFIPFASLSKFFYFRLIFFVNRKFLCMYFNWQFYYVYDLVLLGHFSLLKLISLSW